MKPGTLKAPNSPTCERPHSMIPSHTQRLPELLQLCGQFPKILQDLLNPQREPKKNDIPKKKHEQN
jgi:hypothetical protein